MNKELQEFINLFYREYYPFMLESDEKTWRADHERLLKLKPAENISEFYEKYMEKTDLFSQFKSEIVGVGIDKIRYNEVNMVDFNIYECRSLYDFLRADEKVSYDLLERNKETYTGMPFDERLQYFSTWSYFCYKGIHVPLAITNTTGHAFDLFSDWAFSYAEQLSCGQNYTWPTRNKKYKNAIIERMQRDLSTENNTLCHTFALKVKEHVESFPCFFLDMKEPDNTNILIIPSNELAKEVDLYRFYEGIEKIGYQPVSELDRIIETYKESLLIEVKSLFDRLYEKHRGKRKK